MSLNWKPTEGSWKMFLAWLNPDPEMAARKYEEIRTALIAFFIARRWACAEDMADEIIDRVIRRGAELFDSYEGDPKHYFKKAASNLHLDYTRKPLIKSEDEIDEEPDKPYDQEVDEELRYAC